MTDTHVEDPGEEDRLPWLEAVDEEDEGSGPSTAKLIAAVVIGLVCIGLFVGGLFWLGDRAQDENGELIAAPEGDYKVKPDDPGGMEVEGEGDTAFAASEGAEPKGRLNVDAVPEQPVTQQPTTPAQQPAASQPAAPGATVQLGAFSSQAAANRAWAGLSGRFAYLEPLSHSVVSIEAGGRTLYRLRASGSGAADICRRLQVAGETCVLVQ